MKAEEEEKQGDGGAAAAGDSGKDAPKVPLYRLFTFADGKDLVFMVVGAVAAIGNGLALPIMSIIFGDLIDAFSDSAIATDTVVDKVSKVVLKFVYLGIGAGLASLLQVSFWMVTGERQSARIRGLYLKTILRQDIAFFDKETSTGEVVGRTSGDTILIQDAMGEKVGKFIQLISTFIGGFVVAFIKGWLLALVLTSCIPLIVISGAAMAITISKLSSRGQLAYTDAGNVVEQTIGSIRTVVSFNGEKKATESYNKSLKTAYSSTKREGFVTGLGLGVLLCVLFCSYGLAIWYGSKLIISSGYTGGTVINVLIAIMTGGMSLGQASPSINAFSAGQAAAYRMFETIKRKPDIDAYNSEGLVLEDIKGDIELRNVSFSYPTRPEFLVFDSFSLSIDGGTTTALVGESGSGKSTVISLVERFYDPQAGQVLIDGVNLKDMRLGWIRQKIGLVSQEPVLFATTIKENIMYGKDNATPEEIKVATELANASKFIDKLPEGIETMVGERGTQLSGGQKQRIAIARAILKNPKILLLDEATSALDTESEHIVQEALLRIMVERTTIVVAHRLSTVRNADSIAVVHRGKIVEQGSHVELTKNPDGPYSQLIRLQEGEDESKEKTILDLRRSTTSFKSKRSGSLRGSLAKSRSKGSSIGSSGRHSFRSHFGLDGTILPDGHEPDDQNEGGENESHDVRKKVSLKRLAYLNKPEVPVLLLGSVAAAVHGVTFPIFGLLLSTAIKIFSEPEDQLKKDSKFWASMFVLLGGVCLISLPLQYYLFSVAGGKLIQRIRSLSFNKVVHQEIGWFDEPSNSSGTIGARLSGDASSVKSLVGDTLSLIVQNISTVTAGLLIAFIANWKLTFIVLVIIPLVGLQGYAQIKFLKGFSQDAKVMFEEASQVANDAVSSIRTVASFCAEKKTMDIYNEKCRAPKEQGIRQGIVSGLGFGFSNLMLFGTYALTFYIGALFVQNGIATFAQVFKVFFALVMTAIGVSQTSALGPDTTKANDSASSIFAILDRKSLIDSSNEDGTTIDVVIGNIEFKHVSFKYPTRPEVQIFRDLNLKIPSGKTVALVGESGSGKSTVIALLERFYDAQSGEIFLDGTEIKTLKLRWLRQQMGLVSQEPVLFNETIRTNIAYGKHGEVSEEEIIVAAKAANAHGFISSLPNGYDTSVGERGVQMSGGQKQRIAIARAILKNPKILLLDEATSALDAESEHVVQEALDRVMTSRTTLVVAHRLSTIKGADIIAVVKNGEIAEQGRHEVLIGIKGGAYASLVSLHGSSS